MRWSQAFLPTFKEVPSDAEELSHQLMLRSGQMRPLTAGVYSYLPLGWRAIRKAMAIIREEMDRIGGQEFMLPVLAPAEIWNETGRLKAHGDLMFKLKDRKQRELCLCPTHEEVIVSIARNQVRSWRVLPQIWYQIQTKFRDELRPRSGVLRARQFTMKDAYSLGADFGQLDQSYELHRTAYERISRRCGLSYVTVKASSGLMGGSDSEEFMVQAAAGEDTVVRCTACSYAANTEVAQSRMPQTLGQDGALEEVHTPGYRTVEEVSGFLKVKPEQLMKSLVIIHQEKPAFILVRGDDEMNESKVSAALGGEWRPAEPQEVLALCRANVGYVSPVGIKDVRILADLRLEGAVGLVSGANKEEYHLKNISLARDVKAEKFADLRMVKDGEACPKCGKPLAIIRAIEIGHIFKLGLKYSTAMNATFQDAEGNEKPIVMGSYGIGVERIIASAIEQESGHDKDGIIWPMSLAPYQVLVLPINMSHKETVDTAEVIYRDCQEAGIEVLLDDRDDRPGVKFKDADLIGVPIRVTIGEKTLAEGKVEVKLRREKAPVRLAPSEAAPRVKALIAEELARLSP
jgi:prolyl-tRNA synthetase